MAATDIDKKAGALVSGVREHRRNPEREARIVKVADGNPRLLEWLMALAIRSDVIEDAFLNQLDATVSKFRENLLAEKLLAPSASPSARRWPA